jgi:hypothetical protein
MQLNFLKTLSILCLVFYDFFFFFGGTRAFEPKALYCQAGAVPLEPCPSPLLS